MGDMAIHITVILIIGDTHIIEVITRIIVGIIKDLIGGTIIEEVSEAGALEVEAAVDLQEEAFEEEVAVAEGVAEAEDKK